jgi:CheY-like chemotaxis protein
MEGERIEVHLRHLVKELESIIKNTFPKDIQLTSSFPTDTRTIFGDPTQIHQLLLNLCVNARDAMPGGGNLRVNVENSSIDEQFAAMNLDAKVGPYVKISVSDTGMGIPRGVIDRIFEPFFTTKDQNNGTGLGLSMVAAIVKSHEGFLTVYSELGKGTTFNVYLPSVKASSGVRKDIKQSITLPQGNGETVLVVDDEPSIVIVTSRTLAAFGYKVLTASNGADALGVFLQHQNEISVVLTDMAMPVMDGPALIHALKRINPEIKIIGASGLNANGGVAKATTEGVRHFLAKPFTADALVKVLRATLDQN